MNTRQEIFLAKEIKTGFYFFLIALIVGLGSYVINKSFDKKIQQYQDLENKWKDVKNGSLYPGDSLIDDTKAMGCYGTFLNDRPDVSGILDTIQYKIENIKKPYMKTALRFALIVLGVLVLGRYVLKLGSWVNKTLK